jgi:hypothetical protein
MRICGIFIFFIYLSFTFSSCNSAQKLQRNIQGWRSGLYYELTTDEYSGEVSKTVYLNFIDTSNMDYFSSVKKKGTFVVPLLFFNYIRENFNVTLGERTLMQSYRDFLTEALLTECNRSSCFNLENNTENIAPDSAYVLNISITQNHTGGQVVSSETSLFVPPDIFINFQKYKINPAVCDLQITTSLVKNGNNLYGKTYRLRQELNCNRSYKENENLLYAVENCLDNMTECLSFTTKNMVEDISRSLHLLMLGEK